MGYIWRGDTVRYGKGFFLAHHFRDSLRAVSQRREPGSLTLNATSGVGMISVGVLGASFLGTLQDVALDRNLSRAHRDAYQVVTEQPQAKFAFTFHALDAAKIERLPQAQRSLVEKTIAETKQAIIAKFSILSAMLMFCYLGLHLYFKFLGG
jgi:hypothetical protein